MPRLELKHDRATKSPRLTVVFLHGIAADASDFDGLLSHLESIEALRDVRFITVNLLGWHNNAMCTSYDYAAQTDAIKATLDSLNIETPLVLIGHSMGALIATKYASLYPHEVRELVLLSMPLFTKTEMQHPAFAAAMKQFEAKVSISEPAANAAFHEMIEKIVMNQDNYDTTLRVSTPKTIIYGANDSLVMPQNYQKVQADSTAKVDINQTSGKHGVTPDKFSSVEQTLERILNEII